MEIIREAQKFEDPVQAALYKENIELLFHQYVLPHLATVESMESSLGEGKLTYPNVDAMAFQLALQLATMENRGYTLLFWQPSDILVVELKRKRDTLKLYILANFAQLVPLQKKDETQLVLVYPSVFPLPADKCAPELLYITVLPLITHKSASYYSLAIMCLKLVNLSLAELKGTKLFYFLERCLKKDPKERMLIYL
jgi:hypothetical protein